MNRILFAAPNSGSGKTVITCAVIKALMIKGLQVSAFKCGPDYIDPMFHRHVLGAETGNLDTFFCSEEHLRYILKSYGSRADISVIEGVMGYYDGLGGTSDTASTYDVSRVTETPTVIILDCKGASLSLVAVLKGILEYRSDSNIKGVILNKTNYMMYRLLKDIIEEELGIKVYGYLPTIHDFKLKSRHLGLIMPNEIEGIRRQMEHLAIKAIETIDIDGLIELSETAGQIQAQKPEVPKLREKVRLAVAMDGAFCFYYRENLSLLEEMGAELVEFSPLYDEKLPDNIQGLLLGGGYPELFTKELSINISMRESVLSALNDGLPCIAECGGFLYLLKSLESLKMLPYSMVGFLEGEGFKTDKLVRFGYINMTTNLPTIFGERGVQWRGHEFHYWDSSQTGDVCDVEKPIRGKQWRSSVVKNNTFAGFAHIHFYSNIPAAFEFLKCCERRKL